MKKSCILCKMKTDFIYLGIEKKKRKYDDDESTVCKNHTFNKKLWVNVIFLF